MMSSEPGAHSVPDQRGVDLFTSDPASQAPPLLPISLIR